MSLLLDLIFPRRCYQCGHIGQYLCPECLRHLIVRSFQPPLDGSSLDGHLSIFPYDQSLRQLIVDIKYHFISDVSAEISRYASFTLKRNFPTITKLWRSRDYLFTPIPLHLYRQNWRGFNQSALLGIPVAAGLKLKYYPDLLVRCRHTATQVAQAHRAARLTNLNNAFEFNPRYHFNIPQNVILFDDVYTTGATLESAAQVLKDVGVRSIIGLTLAG